MNGSRPIVFASRVAPTYKGGLAFYQRHLAQALVGLGFEGCSLCEQEYFNSPSGDTEAIPWPLRRLEPSALGRLVGPLLPQLAACRRIPWLAAWFLARRLHLPSDRRPRAVHVIGTGWEFTGFAVARWARRLGVPLTVWPAIHQNSWGDDAIDAALYRQADTIFCATCHEAGRLVDLGISSEKLTVCGLPPFCATDGDGLRLRERLGIGQRPAAFFLGRRDAGKGFPAVCSAWKRVLEQHPEAVLLVAGPGDAGTCPPLADLPQGSFRDLGVIGERDKVDAYDACDVFCLPSAHESFGIVYVEAWSYGKPVICGPSPASRELVEEGKTGLWARQDPSELAEKIGFFFANPGEARRMGENGRRTQASRFTMEAMVAAHLQAWRIAFSER